MRRTLQTIATLIAIGAVAAWVALGANRGWTKTRAQVKTIEPVTGLEDLRWEDKFQPGVELLAAALLGAGALAGAARFIKPKTKSENIPT